MGTWGYRLYENDTTLDLREYFENCMREGKAFEEALEEVISEFDMNNNPTEDPDIEVEWFALADTLWRCGRLTPEIKEKVLTYLEDSSDLRRWEEVNPKFAPKRKTELEKLKEKLQQEQRPAKTFRKKREKKGYICPWKIGDVYAYPMTGPDSEGTEFYRRYAICIKVDNYEHRILGWDEDPADILPVVWIKLTKDNQLPATVEEIDALEFVQMRHYAHVPRVFDRERFIFECNFFGQEVPSEEKLNEIEENYNKEKEEEFDHSSDYLTDINHHLHYFRTYLPNYSKRSTPKYLIYLGNYKVAPPPLEDVFVHCIIGHWKFFERDIIKQYRENKAYNESIGWPEKYL